MTGGTSGLAEIDWSAYQGFGPGLEVPLSELPPIQALVALDRLGDDRGMRIAALKALVARQRLALDGTDASICRLSRWFVRHVEDAPGEVRLRPLWYSVVNDIALYLGELLIARSPNLRWLFELEEVATMPTAEAGQPSPGSGFMHPSLAVVFPLDDGSFYPLPLDELIADYGLAVRSGQHVDPDYFLNVLLAGVLAA